MATIEKGQQLPLFDSLDDDCFNELHDNNGFSDYIVYVDESGDHNLVNVNQDYPVFVLAFTVFHKRHYAEKVVPAVEKFKFNHFGHDLIVLHENEIRKQKNQFKILINKARRTVFMEELTSIMQLSNFVLMSCVIDKNALKQQNNTIDNPYNIALGHCLESLYDFLSEKGQQHRKTHVLLECRGKKEDSELELEFRRICDGNNHKNQGFNFEAIFVDKKTNSTGLQLADLVARPIGLNTIRPKQHNRPFEILKEKFFCKGGRNAVGTDYHGYGLKVVPQHKTQKPNSKKAKSPDEPTET